MYKQLLKIFCLTLLLSACFQSIRAEENLQTGTLNRVVVFARFNGDPDFENSKSYYQDFFNGMSENSVKNYFNAISNGKLTVNSILFPKTNQAQKSYELKYCYFCYDATWSRDYPSCKGNDISILPDIAIGFTIKDLAGRIEPDMDAANIDKDNDGYVDNFVILLRGDGRGNNKGIYSPQNGEVSERFTTTNGEITLKGKKIKKYTILYERNSFDTHCRYLLNSIGFPNLYRTKSVYPRTVGTWDPMDGPQLTYPLVYNRWKYSGNTWTEQIPTVESNKTYTINSSDKSTNVAYKIPTDNPDEFFVLEYRNNTVAYNRNLPGSGLLIYRVNTTQNGSENQIPEFYMFRKDGTPTVNGDLSQAPFDVTYGRNTFNSTTNPYPFSGTGEALNTSVYNIKAEGQTLTFSTGSLPTAIPPVETGNSVVAYPTLTQGPVNIYGNWDRATVLNLSGTKLIERNLSASGEINQIDLQYLSTGIYLLKLQRKTESKTIKIIRY